MWQMALDSELIVAGAILGDSRTLRVIRAELSADDFRTELGRVVFTAACSLEDDGKPVDPVTIKAEAASNGTALTIQDLSSPKYYSTAAQAVQGALYTAMRQSVEDGSITTLQDFIKELERRHSEFQAMIAPLNGG